MQHGLLPAKLIMKKAPLLVVLVFLYCVASAQSFDECVQLFQINKYTEAISGLERLQKDGATSKDASLLLSIIREDLGHYNEAFEDFKKVFDQSDNPYPYFYARHSGSLYDTRNENVREFLEKVLTDPRADMASREVANEGLAAVAIRKGDFDGARALYKHNGDVKNWSTVGVFENISGSGFNKDFGVLAHPEGDYEFTNKIGASVKWFNLNDARTDRWYDFELHYTCDNSVVYAQTFIQSAEAQEAVMKLGVSGSLKVWVNDFLVGSEQTERNTNSDVFSYQVRFQKGFNRVLVQLGSSEIRSNNFMMRLYDVKGNLLEDLVTQSSYKPYNKATPYEVKRTPFFAEQYFETLVAAGTGNRFLNLLMLMNTYDRNENRDPAFHVLAQLKAMAPYCSYISETIISLATKEKNLVTVSKEKESIKTHDPESPSGLVLRYYEALGKEKWDDAIALMDRYMALYGERADGELKLIEALYKKKDNERVTKEIDKAFNSYPDVYDIVMDKFAIALNGTKDLRAANEILVKCEKQSFSPAMLVKIKDNYFKLGEKEEGMKCFRKMLEYSPGAVGWYRDYAKTLYEMHEYDQALEMINKSIEYAPYSEHYFPLKASIYVAKGMKSEAIEALKMAIRYSPTNYAARKKLNELENKKDPASYFVENDIQKLVADARASNGYTDEDEVCLLNDKKQVVYKEQGAVTEQNELLFLVKSSKGIERFKEMEIPYNSNTQRLIVEKAELLKKDGSKVSADRHLSKCVFSSLEVGDVVHIAYKLEASYSGKLAEHFWDNFYFNGRSPVKMARYSLVVPANKKFSYKMLNGTLEPTIKDIDDYKLYVWEQSDNPKITPEPAMSVDVAQQLILSSIPDWNYVANWYSDLSNIKTHADKEIKEKVAGLLAGNEHASDLVKARLLYNYIEENFHYSAVPFLHSALIPQSASRTFSAKLGDCKDLATLFVSMAREAGLDASLVLVSTRGEDDNEFQLPTIAFNHCIARLHSNNNDYIIELTNNYLPFATMFFSILNANGLYIPKDGGTATNASIVKLNTPVAPVNINYRTSKVTLSGNKALVHRHVAKLGSESAFMRIYFKGLSESEQIKKLGEDINTEFGKNVTMSNLKFKGLDHLTDTVEIDYDFAVEKFVSTIVGMSVIKMPWTMSQPFTQLFSLENRKYDIELWPVTAAPIIGETIAVTIPTGKKLAEKLVDVNLSCPVISYSLKYKVTGNQLEAKREFRFLKDRVTPAEYASVKATMAKIIEADTKEIAFK